MDNAALYIVHTVLRTNRPTYTDTAVKLETVTVTKAEATLEACCIYPPTLSGEENGEETERVRAGE